MASTHPPVRRLASAASRTFAVLLVTIGACSDGAATRRADPRETEALAAFERFQDALFAKDRAALRAALTSESRLALTSLLALDMTGKQRLLPRAVTGHADGFTIHADDPNTGDEARYVVVREDRAFCVDLVATTAHHHETRATPTASPQLAPAALDPDEVRRAEALLRKHDR